MSVDFDSLRLEITRDNALALLRDVACPNCGTVGRYQLFDEINNGGVGIECTACARRNPFKRERILYLRSEGKRRSNDIAAVIEECGAYCYICGETFEELKKRKIGAAVHHARPFADHGERYKKIPVCSECHELANFQQRARRRATGAEQ